MKRKVLFNFLTAAILLAGLSPFYGRGSVARAAGEELPFLPPPPGGAGPGQPVPGAQLPQGQPGAPAGTSFDWSATGEAVGGEYGFSLASAGDVNGDGFDELIVGAPYYNNRYGKVYLYYGSADGLSATPGWSVNGGGSYNYFGTSVASADVNGDGYSDVIVGAIYTPLYGKVYVYYGSSSGLSSTPGWSAYGEGIYDNFGWSVASAGDVNGDGFADVLVGAPEYWLSGPGKAYVYYGSANGPSAAPDWKVTGEFAGDYFGWSVASARDLNGDGYSEVIVSQYRDPNYVLPGKVYVYYGSGDGLSAIASWSADGEADNKGFGWCVASAGDVDGDGFDDLAVMSFYKTYVYSGSAEGLGASPSWSVSQGGGSVAPAGDVDGDGFGDLIAGFQNTASIFTGSAGGLHSVPFWNATGENSGDYFGWWVDSAGDVNGDGLPDVAVGAAGYSSWTGKAYAFYHAGEYCTLNCLRVNGLQMKVVLQGVGAHVLIQDENGQPVRGAEVSAHWVLPGGATLDQTGTTHTTGTVTFRVQGGAGSYSATVTNITFSGYTFDPAHSAILTKSITK